MNERKTEFRMVPIDHVSLPAKNLRDMQSEVEKLALVELVASVKEHGIIQPIVVKPTGTAKFEVVAGIRRLMAAKEAKLDVVPAMVMEADESELSVVTLTENVLRKDIHPLDEAEGIYRLMQLQKCGPERICEVLGLPKRHVLRILLLRRLNPDTQKLFRAGTVTFGAAYMLARMSEAYQGKVLKEVRLRGQDGEVDVQTIKYAASQCEAVVAGFSFPLEDATFGAQPCDGCAKRSAKNPDLFEKDEVKKDLCSDLFCASAKLGQFIEQKAVAEEQKLKDVKVIVVDGGPDHLPPIVTKRPVFKPQGYPNNYVHADSGDECESVDRAFVARTAEYDQDWKRHVGKFVWICRNKDCQVHWKKGRNSSEGLRTSKQEQVHQKELHKLRFAEHRMHLIFQGLLRQAPKTVDPENGRPILDKMLDRVGGDVHKYMARALDLAPGGKTTDKVEAFEKMVKGLKGTAILQMLHVCRFYPALMPYGDSKAAKAFEQAAVDWKLDMKAIEAEAETRADRRKTKPKPKQDKNAPDRAKYNPDTMVADQKAAEKKDGKTKATHELAEVGKRKAAKKALKKSTDKLHR